MNVPSTNASSSSTPWKHIRPEICFHQKTVSLGLWFGDNPMDFIVPVMLLQLILVFSISRTIHWLLRPFKQPKFICNVLAGIILGPSVMGRNDKFSELLFNPKGIYLMHAISILGSSYFVFLIAVKLNGSILKTARGTWIISLTSYLLPLFTAMSMHHALKRHLTEIRQGLFPFFFSSILSLTYFPVIAHALDELNLITSELGQLALSLSMTSDAINLLVVAGLVILKQDSAVKSVGVVVSLVALVFFTVFVIKPAISAIIKTTPKGKPVKQIYIVAIFTGVAVMGAITDMIGVTMLVGALLLGLAIPDGPPLGSTLTEKAEILISEVFLPFVFVHVGYKTNIYSIKDWKAFAMFQLIILAAYGTKLVGTFLGALHCKIVLKNAILLSLIMSIRGIIEIFHYRKWLISKYIDSQAFTQLVLSVVSLTMIVTPIIDVYYRRHIRINQPKSTRHDRVKSIAELSNSPEFRIISCIHSQESVHSIITLLESSNPSEANPIFLYVIHLVEFVGRNIPLLIPHDKQRRRSRNANLDNSENIMRAFENFSRNSKGPMTVYPFISIAPYKTMHESICRLARDSLVHFIIVPFCRNRRFEGENQTIASMRHFSASLQESAPCTVGILVDRTLNLQLSSVYFSYRVAVIFVGGADDREAMAFANRMSGNSDVSITVLHFIIRGNEKKDDEEWKVDEFMVDEFKLKNARNPKMVVREIMVDDGVKLINSLRCIENEYDLIMVGRRQGKLVIVDEEMSRFIEIPELGVIGDMFASSDICGEEVSILVMQHANDEDDDHSSNSSDDSQISLKGSDFQKCSGG